jgi:DNA processing protein
LMISDRQTWLTVAATEGLGPSALQKIWKGLEQMRSGPEVLLELTPEELEEQLGLSTAVSTRLADRLREPLDEPAMIDGTTLLSPADDDFPGYRFASAVPPFPALLWVVGERRLLVKPQPFLGVAGSRDASERVLELAFEISKEASLRGVTVVSGLAQGVDSAAHQGALSGRAGTVGVMASGILRHSGYVPEDLDSACLISQFDPTEPWSGQRAMARNSTIAGLSDRVVVCASGLSGGSWEMGQLCIRKKKPLFVLDLDDSEAPGNRALIRAGAVAVGPDDLEAIWVEADPSPEQQSLF